MNRSVIVIGGAGFLGKQILEKLIKFGFTRISCADIVDPNIDGVEFHRTDILNEMSLSAIQLADIVINCTGQVTFPIEKCLQLNSEGLLNILRSINKKSHFIQLSTVGVYGETETAFESTPLNPQTAYSTAKAMAEFIVSKECAANYTILRLSNLYGPGQPKGLMAYLQRALNSDMVLEFNHSGNMIRSFLHVEDCAVAICSIAKETALGIFNVAGDKPVSIPDLIKLIENIKNIKYTVTWGQQPSWENIQIINTEKIKKTISINQNYSVEEYIRSAF